MEQTAIVSDGAIEKRIPNFTRYKMYFFTMNLHPKVHVPYIHYVGDFIKYLEYFPNNWAHEVNNTE